MKDNRGLRTSPSMHSMRRPMHSIARIWICGVIGCLLTACGTQSHRASLNSPICPQAEASRAPVECHTGGPIDPNRPGKVSRASLSFREAKDLPAAFVGLSISGGGSRASNFGLATIRELKKLGLMEHISAISTTSGGGLPGAYFALSPEQVESDQTTAIFRTNFLGSWLARSLLPPRLISSFTSSDDRSQIMADIFDEELFHGARYRDLGEYGANRPIWIANATLIGHLRRFSFTEEEFQTVLRARLDDFPISRAVMASAAFPGVFSSLTLRRFPESPQQSDVSVPIGYQHVIDGGPTDNLGVDALLRLAVAHQNEHADRRTASRGCFIFVADAYPEGVPDRLDWSPDPRRWYDRLVDTNIFDAFDALLAKRRDDTLRQLGFLSLAAGSGFGFEYFAPGLPPAIFASGSAIRVVDVPELLSVSDSEIVRPVRFLSLAEDLSNNDLPPTPDGHVRCVIWHLNLSGLLTPRVYVGAAGDRTFRAVDDAHDSGSEARAVLEHRVKLGLMVSQIDTNFRLAGPRNCSPARLQDAIFNAARVLIREDYDAQHRACAWFRAAGLRVAESCGIFPGNGPTDATTDIRTTARRISEVPMDRSVECETP